MALCRLFHLLSLPLSLFRRLKKVQGKKKDRAEAEEHERIVQAKEKFDGEGKVTLFTVSRTQISHCHPTIFSPRVPYGA